jgi:phage terminase large subunit
VQLNLELLQHQADFVEDTTTRNIALVGGYGAGKTKALATKLIVLSILNAGFEGIALSPTYGMSQKVLIPEIEAQLREYQIPFRLNKSDLVFYIHVTPIKLTKLHILAAETYKRAAGINAAFFGVDEADLIDPNLARAAWQMLSSRLRKGLVYQGCAVSTPEGFNFLWEFFKKEVEEDPKLNASRRLIKAKTLDNPFLPESYIEELRTQFDPLLLTAYMDGEFVNMVGSPVYSAYDKELNDTELTVDELHRDIPLHCGIDFNNNNMSCTVGYVAANKAYIIDELMGHKNTMALIHALKARYGEHREIYVYPDASGKANKTSASSSDIEQLTAAGFQVFALNGNPPVKNRINSVNARFANGQMPPRRALFVNQRTCKTLVKCLLQQTYKLDGSPVKDNVLDGPVDALGYFVYYIWPIDSRQSFTQSTITA